jgi:predicted RNA binding protein YcfA (HicA-like mRNA interferase family)
MPPKLPIVSGERAIRVMERLGFVCVRQRGSHVVLRKQTSDFLQGWTSPKAMSDLRQNSLDILNSVMLRLGCEHQNSACQ